MARYDDKYVDELKSLCGTGQGIDDDIASGGVGGDGKHDTTKMFRSCGKMIAGHANMADEASIPHANEADEGSMSSHTKVSIRRDISLTF